MPASITIPARYNGPLEHGNGGYSAGVLAGFLDGAVEVKLRRPVPLDRELAVEEPAPSRVLVRDGDELIMEARSVGAPELEPPKPVSLEEARAATRRYRGLAEGTFSRCFVCGRAREDAFGVFAGNVDGRAVVASPWTPPDWTADEAGAVRPEFVWAVLDCPTYFALYADGELPMSVLAQITADLRRPVRSGVEHVVIGWPIEIDGRKAHAGSAVLSAEGDVLAVARALLIELRS